jgi:hypothetical protein
MLSIVVFPDAVRALPGLEIRCDDGGINPTNGPLPVG